MNESQLREVSGVSRGTFQRAIAQLQKDGMLYRIGQGKRGDPYRYYIPQMPSAQTPSINGPEEMRSLGALPDNQVPTGIEMLPNGVSVNGEKFDDAVPVEGEL